MLQRPPFDKGERKHVKAFSDVTQQLFRWTSGSSEPPISFNIFSSLPRSLLSLPPLT